MKYLKKFNENKFSDYDFNMSIYDPLDKFVVGAYMIIEDTEKSITVLNLKEREDTRGFFTDGKLPYTFTVHKIRLPKSQIEVLGFVEGIEGFNWIKIPYWLTKSNLDLKITRIKDPKRFSNSKVFTKELNPQMINDDVEKYILATENQFRAIDAPIDTQGLKNLQSIRSKG